MNRQTVLIGGGYDKQSTYDEWIESFDGKVEWLVLLGQTKEKIERCALADMTCDTHLLLIHNLRVFFEFFSIVFHSETPFFFRSERVFFYDFYCFVLAYVLANAQEQW